MTNKKQAARVAAAAPARIRIAVVDDHFLAREALVRLLERFEGCEVIFSAEQGEDYIRQCKACGAPDIALVDLMMPVMDGWVTIAWIREHHPGTRPIAITFAPDPEPVRLAWKAGACAVLPKSVSRNELITALDDVALTRFHRNDLVQMRLLEKPVREMERVRTTNEKIEDLSDRERETLIWLADSEGLNVPAIALKMGVEPCTVQTWCHNIYVKLGVKNRAQAVAFAFEHKLVVR